METQPIGAARALQGLRSHPPCTEQRAAVLLLHPSPAKPLLLSYGVQFLLSPFHCCTFNLPFALLWYAPLVLPALPVAWQQTVGARVCYGPGVVAKGLGTHLGRARRELGEQRFGAE